MAAGIGFAEEDGGRVVLAYAGASESDAESVAFALDGPPARWAAFLINRENCF